ncbi:hypothetical protein [Chondrinema litorale]|uniref:hypothetical protein n=1 Tax=Chondrinema litorale TaxID=2994555 RepID=UPI002543C9CE|nr:hypothetical protein [Chondrinema litorale]UZR93630.1 hypothetical protein OQ292_17410 [Chondrinema litorale]
METKTENTRNKKNIKLIERDDMGIDPALPKEYEPIISLAIMMGAVFIIGYLLLSTGFFG